MRRWAEVSAAAMFINTSYGTMSYAFSVLVTRSAAGGDFGVGTVSLGFGAALLVSGVVSIGTGAFADLYGSRRLMGGGALLGAASLALLAGAESRLQAVLVMALLMGPAMAATFYEPVYVLMNRWFTPEERPRAYGVLTLLSGFSITIYTPLTRWLVSEFGWREGVLVLAGCLACVGTVVPAVIREPKPVPFGPVNAPGRRLQSFLGGLGSGLAHADRRFWAFSGAAFVATAAFSGFSFHQVAQLESRGFDETGVARAIALTGIVSLPARLLLPALSGRASSVALLAACFGALGVSAWLATVASGWWQVWLYIGLFGAVFGAVYPLRALATVEQFPGEYFGRLIGLQAFLVAVARAAGPVLVGAAGGGRDEYTASFRIAGSVLGVAGVLSWLVMRRRKDEAGPRRAAS